MEEYRNEIRNTIEKGISHFFLLINNILDRGDKFLESKYQNCLFYLFLEEINEIDVNVRPNYQLVMIGTKKL